MITEYHFPTPIYIKDLPNAVQLNQYLEQQILERHGFHQLSPPKIIIENLHIFLGLFQEIYQNQEYGMKEHLHKVYIEV